jgi:hypothetical protein
VSRFTKALRQQIVSEFTAKNGGWFDPSAFVAEVQRVGSEHPAYEWFQWDDDKAAQEFRLDQARDFTRGLIVRFEIRTMHRGSLRIVEHSTPLVISPLATRNDSGGYYLTDPNDPAHMAELCRQAAQSLRWFIGRYEGALAFAGVNIGSFDRARTALEAFEEKDEAA